MSANCMSTALTPSSITVRPWKTCINREAGYSGPSCFQSIGHWPLWVICASQYPRGKESIITAICVNKVSSGMYSRIFFMLKLGLGVLWVSLLVTALASICFHNMGSGGALRKSHHAEEAHVPLEPIPPRVAPSARRCGSAVRSVAP